MSDTRELPKTADGPSISDLAATGEETTSLGRRAFLRNTGLTTLGAMVGMSIPFEGNLPSGVLPVMAQDTGEALMPDKPDLVMLNDRPLNAETPAHL
ncbi:MAG TPA: molybdopterin containing oxidoreductase, partial [Paracoccaceae bacterium]|nr:molybdopterin containing oxidoreductase [Paracoccaceae bacterium]